MGAFGYEVIVNSEPGRDGYENLKMYAAIQNMERADRGMPGHGGT
jgi:hypothetical protein